MTFLEYVSTHTSFFNFAKNYIPFGKKYRLISCCFYGTSIAMTIGMSTLYSKDLNDSTYSKRYSRKLCYDIFEIFGLIGDKMSHLFGYHNNKQRTKKIN